MNYSSFKLRFFIVGSRRIRINILQKKTIRVFNISLYISRSEPIFKSLKILNRDDVIILTNCQISS